MFIQVPLPPMDGPTCDFAPPAVLRGPTELQTWSVIILLAFIAAEARLT